MAAEGVRNSGTFPLRNRESRSETTTWRRRRKSPTPLLEIRGSTKKPVHTKSGGVGGGKGGGGWGSAPSKTLKKENGPTSLLIKGEKALSTAGDGRKPSISGYEIFFRERSNQTSENVQTPTTTST